MRAEQGMKLAQFFVHVHKHLSGRAARRLLEDGCCRINGRIETFGSRELRLGEVVEFFLPEESHEHTFDRRRVIFSGSGLIAYDKPGWLPVTPTEGPKSWSLLDILKPEFTKNGGLLIPVHRLDADTSGIVLMATEERVARALEDMFRDHVVKKQYTAIVRGHPRETGSRRSYLVKVDSGRGFEKWQSGRGADAREAVTNWTVEARLGTYGSRVLVEPQTGRYHQIRIHFSEMGHPIYGDRIYGDRKDPIHVTRHLLHASRVTLPDPAGGRDLEIRSSVPREFAQAEEQLRRI
ncbi:MAG: RluA family pseudouridine synthase [Planctomycetes bacterium]|nr:RluA family pseudouridine synthase [Planctomycetota bacterium]